MQSDGACFKCRKDLHKGKEKYVVVNFGGNAREFHPDCHICSGPCGKALRAGTKYTVVPATGLPLCETCWQKEHNSSASLPAASGGVSWTPKAPALKGFVWSQVELLDHSTPAAAAATKAEVSARPLGTCRACHKKIYDQMISIDSTALHVECHKCSKCSKSLGDGSFYMDSDKSVCENCYSKKVSSIASNAAASSPGNVAPQSSTKKSLGTCAACHKQIFDKIVSANGQSYCDGCLKCLKCKAVIGGRDAFFPRENGVICENCGS